VAGAHVTATNVETNLVKETTSGPDGEYRLLALPAGTYKVTATATGFQDFEATGIQLNVNDRLKIDAVLEVGTIKQAVSVEANAVQVET
jgi:Carboxypeptidase regulatory-like domain